jgi:PAS domain S-box-containing protein
MKKRGINVPSERSGNLHKEEDKYRSLFENVHDGIYQSTMDGKILTANPALVKMLGYKSEKELKKMNIGRDLYVDPSQRDSFTQELKEKDRLRDVELILKRKDGAHIIALENSHTIRNENGDILYYEGTLTEITERKHAEEALRESKNRYYALIETSQDGISLLDLDGKLQYFNQRKKRMFGYTSDEELLQVNAFNLIHPDDQNLVRNLFQDLLQKGTIIQAEVKVLRKDGSFFWAEFNATLLRDIKGSPFLVMDTMRDITERKRSAEEMRLHLEQLRQIIDLVPSYIFAKDIDGKFLLANKAVAEVFGLSPEEIKGKNDSDYGATKEQVEGYRKADLAVIEKDIPIQIPEEQVLRKDGSLGWFQTVKIPYSHPGCDKPAILGVATEITERKEVEDELRKSEERFRKLFESHSAVKLIIDLETGSIVDVNKAAEEYYGWSVSKLRRMNLRDISTMSAEKMKSTMDKARRDKEVFFESSTRLSDGSIREVEVFTSKIEIEGKLYLHSIIHDVTEKKKMLADLITAKERAEESDRLKTAFLHNISHEIRTPMNAIVGFTSLLESPELSDNVRRQYIDLITQSSNQLLSIISDIVDISNIETGIVKTSLSKVNINTSIRNIHDQYSIRAEQENIIFRYHTPLEDDHAEIITDETKLIQIITNLLNNSFKFTRKGSIEYGYTIKGDDIEFFVNDTGIGIEKDKQQKIFDRFYQIENGIYQKTEGTGLGLSISKAYVELLGGRIWTFSQPGKGTTFYFTLPYTKSRKKHAESKKQLNSGKNVMPTRKTILIAEDDNSNFLLLKEMLSVFKPIIIRAVTGQEAVDACRYLEKIDIVLMDIKMPVMDGYQALALIQEQRPGIPVIAITAYALDTDRNKALSSGFTGYVSKPIDRNHLFDLLQDYL